MTPNIAERVDTPEYNQMRLNEIKRGICNCGYCTNIDQDKRFLLSLVDKYQKLVESSKEYLQHSCECLEDAHLFTPCQCGLDKLKKEMKESGLLKEKKEGL